MKQLRRGAALLSLLLIFGCAPAGKPPAPPKTPAKKMPSQAEMSSEGSKISLQMPGSKQTWKAEAARVEGDFISGAGVMYQVKCALLENDRILVSAEAAEARYNKEKQEITLSGGAEVFWPEKKAKMQAEKVVWQLATSLLTADGQVHFSGNLGQLTGNHLQGDLNLKTLEIK
jgi:LPS export ABC transporter protein LptC